MARPVLARPLLRLALAGPLLAAGLVAPALPASAAAPKPLVVDDDRAQCPTAAYTSVQAAIDAAARGAQIRVCDGTYREQLRISGRAKDNLRITGSGVTRVTVAAPATMTEPGDLVTVTGSRGVVLERLTVSGPLPDALFCSDRLRSGVRVVGGGSATLRDLRVTEIRSADPSLRGCQNGFAVAVGRTAEGEVGRVTLERVVLDRYQKGGLYVDGQGSRATLREATVAGDGPLTTIAQNGVQVSRGATASIRDSRVRDHSYTPEPLASGVLVFDAGSVEVSENRLDRNDYGVLVDGASTRATIASNRITGTPGAGGDGIYADPSTKGNVFRSNTVRGNGEHDCHDDSKGRGTKGTANTWSGNTGATSTPVGICTPKKR